MPIFCGLIAELLSAAAKVRAAAVVNAIFSSLELADDHDDQRKDRRPQLHRRLH